VVIRSGLEFELREKKELLEEEEHTKFRKKI
jgi:hypothetical protein